MKNIGRLHVQLDFLGDWFLHFPPHYSTTLHRQPQITTPPPFFLAESALLPGGNDDSALDLVGESALLPGSNDDSV